MATIGNPSGYQQAPLQTSFGGRNLSQAWQEVFPLLNEFSSSFDRLPN